MREVWKFPLELKDEQEVMMPEGADILSTGLQGGTIMLWALVDPDAVKKPRRIEIYGTGHKFHATDRRFVGMVQQDHKTFQLVWHVFEVVEKLLAN